MINYCTLFDLNYLSRGLALYESLCKYCDDFHIFIFAFDSTCYAILKKLDLPHATVISLKEFEDAELLSLKPSRSYVEYCWTCTPSTIKYVLDNYNVDSCTYLDADIYFWDSPAKLIVEMGNDSVLITSHRYSPRYDQSKKSGEYCVQFMPFKNDREGRLVLTWWRNACNLWCYARHEDGKFGDQKYLDDWPNKFRGIHVLNHLGGGVAPWNVQQYNIFKGDGVILGKELKTGKEFQVVFYHFQQLKYYTNEVDFGGYRLSEEVKELIYMPYIRHLGKIKNKLGQMNINVNIHGETKISIRNIDRFLRYLKHRLISNIYKLEQVS